MIARFSHASIYVADQDSALEFYSKKLGFEVRQDVRMGDFRWLTVGPKDQRDMQLILMPLRAGPQMSEDTVAKLESLLKTGALGAGVFQTADCKATYEELSARGVEFTSPPQERPYGIEATFRDDSGNWFSLTQPREG